MIINEYKKIVTILTSNDRNELILPPLLDMLKDDTNDEKRIVGL